MGERDLSIYEPFDRLVSITIDGRSFDVPENNILLRCVQYIVDEGVVPGRFCWNNECGNCELSLSTPSQPDTRRTRGCQTLVQEGMVLSDLSPELRFWLGSKLR